MMGLRRELARRTYRSQDGQASDPCVRRSRL